MMALNYTQMNYNNNKENGGLLLDYLILIDDDYFINPLILTRFFYNEISQFEENQLIAGHVWFNTKPIRDVNDKKWFINYENYPYDFYPNYPTGGFVIISQNLIFDIFTALKLMYFFPFDDALLGFALFSLRIAPRHLHNVYNASPLNNLTMAAHEVKTDKLTMVWQNLTKSQNICFSQNYSFVLRRRQRNFT